jgi:hypothetical protein
LGRGRSSLHGALKVEREDHEHLQKLGYNKHDQKNVPILKNFLQYFRISELKIGNVIINLKTKKSHKSTKFYNQELRIEC